MRREKEDDLDAELASHIDIETDQNIERGMTPEEARYAALRKFGGVALAKEFCREARGFASFDRLRQDLRFALRMFARTPGFTAVAVLSLALGIGATTAIFSVVSALLLRPLPYNDPDRLVHISLTNPLLKLAVDDLPSSPVVIRYWREHVTSFDQIGAFVADSANLTGAGTPVRVQCNRMTASLLPMLGVKPALGRTFTAAEDQPGRDDVVVLSDALWKGSFGGDPAILTRRILLDGRPHMVIGVMPPGFSYPGKGELPSMIQPTGSAVLWKPMAWSAADLNDMGSLSYQPLARLKPGVTLERAQAELNALNERFLKTAPREFGTGWQVIVWPLGKKVASGVRTPALVLLGAIGFLLLIACANLANLLLARAARRREEIAVRMALGAGRFRLARQLLSESLLLAVAGGVLGTALAAASIRSLIALAPQTIPRIEDVSIDLRVLLFSIGVTVLTGILFGLAPAIESLRTSLADSLKSGGGRAAVSAGRRRTRHALVVVEVGLSLVLLTGAVLLVKSFVLLMRVPAGFEAQHVVTMRLPLTGSAYGDFQHRVLFIRELTRRCGALPGAKAAGVIDLLPLTGENNISDLTVEGKARTEAADVPFADFRGITPGYFAAMGIALRSGRNLTEWEPKAVAVISRTAARHFWPGVADPIGRRLKRGSPDEPGDFATVVGIVDDVRSSGLDVIPRPQIYQPYEHFGPPEVTFAVRTGGDPSLLLNAIRAEVRKLDKEQPVTQVRVMRDVVAQSVASRRFQTVVVGAFAVLALLLAGIGIYGVISYSVAQRTHELGLRMALGAQRRDAIAMVLREGLGLAGMGTMAGLAGAFAVTPVLRSLLYGVSALDASVFAASAIALLAIALVASLLPAHRASRIDPMEALRHE